MTPPVANYREEMPYGDGREEATIYQQSKQKMEPEHHPRKDISLYLIAQLTLCRLQVQLMGPAVRKQRRPLACWRYSMTSTHGIFWSARPQIFAVVVWALNTHILTIKAWGFAVGGWASKSFILHFLTWMPMCFPSYLLKHFVHFCSCTYFWSMLFLYWLGHTWDWVWFVWVCLTHI